MTLAITLSLLALVAGSLVFCVLAIVAAHRYLRVPRAVQQGPTPPFSVLKPLAGVDEGLEDNLRSFFEQDYPNFEIILSASTEGDPALPVARRIAARYPHVPSKVLVSGEPAYPNRKVHSIHCMMRQAAHSLLVMSDSDVRVTSDMLRRVAAEFQNPNLHLVTCPYRAVPGNSLWSRLEAVMMNTEFLGGILTARMLDGMRFAVGPTVVCRRSAVDAIGGFETLRDFLAEDFIFGKRVAEKGLGVGLSAYVIEHRIGTSGFHQNSQHRLRWVRSTRRSRPAGYLGQLFTYPLPLALLLVIWDAKWWPLLGMALLLRGWNAWQTGWLILRDPLVMRKPWLVIGQDIVSFFYWIAGFFGNTIAWRGKQFYLNKDGTFLRVPDSPV